MVKLELSTSSGLHLHVFVLVQLQSHVRLLATSWTAPCQAFLSFTVSWSLFQWVDSSQEVDKILELQLQHYSFQRIFRVDFLQDWLIWSPCCPRDSQESSPSLQLECINFSVLSLVYGSTLTSILDYWKYIILLYWSLLAK